MMTVQGAGTIESFEFYFGTSFELVGTLSNGQEVWVGCIIRQIGTTGNIAEERWIELIRDPLTDTVWLVSDSSDTYEY